MSRPTAAEQTETAVDSGVAAKPRVPRCGSRLQSGDRLGRFVVRELVGAGGVGEVYGAYDTVLDRRVALKVLRQRARWAPASRERLLREAQATARLHHRNVVDIFDVGASGDDLFIAMEFIDGAPLSAWAQEQPELDDILDVFGQAGAGLVAAHHAGIVHRDFKPSNVLVGTDDVVRVIDFGLARAFGPPPARVGTAGAAETSGVGGLDDSLTASGMVVGTPAYMAPEQMRGQKADARADQYAFCLALAEVIAGSRPRATVDGTRLGYGALDRSRFAKDRRARRLWPVLQRGLRVSPNDRYPSMRSLLAAIDRERTRPRRTLVAAGVIAAVVACGLVVGAALAPTPRFRLGPNATTAAREAVARCDERPIASAFCAGPRFALARALESESPAERTRARALAERARADYLSLGWYDDARIVEQWLAALD